MNDLDTLVTRPDIMQSLDQSLTSFHSTLLTSAKIKLTSLCNLRCEMCQFAITKKETSLSTEQWKSVLDQLKAMGCGKIHFSGGEMFLRPDALDLVEHGCQLGMKINMTTNGTLFTKDMLRRLVRAKPNSISLSLDGPRPALHDQIRGIPGSFKRTCRTIRRLQELGDKQGRRPKIRLNFVIMQSNYRRTAEMVSLARELEVVELHPMPVDDEGDFRLSLGQMERYNAEIAPQVFLERQKAGFSTDPLMVYPFGQSAEELRSSREGHYSRGYYQQKPCLAPWMQLFLAWDGETFLCCMTNHQMESLGNVGTTPLEEIFNGPAMREVRKKFVALDHHPACARCDMLLNENQRLHAAMSELGTNRAESC